MLADVVWTEVEFDWVGTTKARSHQGKTGEAGE
jgi:hypothetical protein